MRVLQIPDIHSLIVASNLYLSSFVVIRTRGEEGKREGERGRGGEEGRPTSMVLLESQK